MISATTAAMTADEEVIACHDDMMLTQRRCGAELFKRLQELFALRKLSAAEFCELNYWCNGAFLVLTLQNTASHPASRQEPTNGS